MRHRKLKYRLGRTTSHRKALMGNLSIALFGHERIVTTLTKAKALRSTAEKLITLGKRGDLHARRQVMKVISEKKIVKKIFDNLAPRFSDRNGGYTRVMKIAPRRGDGAEMAIIELVDYAERQREAEVAAEKKAKTAKSKKAKAVKPKETKAEKPKAKADKAGEEGAEKQEKAKEAKPDKQTKAKTDKSKKTKTEQPEEPTS